MATTRTKWPKRVALVVGGLLFLGAALWCMGGAGIYGSPLTGMQTEELTRVWAFLLLGPFSALPAGILARWQGNLSAIWFVLGGLISGGVAVTFLDTDAGLFPMILVSLPMIAVGLCLFATLRMGEPVATVGRPRDTR